MGSGGGEHLFSENMTTGDIVMESKFDLSTTFGRIMQWINTPKSYEKEPVRDGGGIRFTSRNGRGGAPVATDADGTPEDIDLLIATLGISQGALSQQSTGGIESIAKWLRDHSFVQASLHDLIQKAKEAQASTEKNTESEDFSQKPPDRIIEVTKERTSSLQTNSEVTLISGSKLTSDTVKRIKYVPKPSNKKN